MSGRTFPTVGILGGGQLGRMLALAGIRMGLKIRFLAPAPDGPMMGLGTQQVGDWNDPDLLRSFVTGCDVVTVESEWAPGDLAAQVAPPNVAVWPAPETLQIVRHKGVQKDRMRDADLPVPPYFRAATLDEALAAADTLTYPVVVKKYQGSYDGYGNETAADPEALRRAWEQLADWDGALIEAWVPFDRELAVLIARRPDGEHVVYPVAHTIQKNHRCHTVIVPADIPASVEIEAKRVALGAVGAIGGVGITAVELFAMPDGRVYVNELAPRPHNTGHYSIEGCYTSQFENHLRAVLGWPLGDPRLREPAAVMVNLLGDRSAGPSLDGYEEALATPGVAVHIYGKDAVMPNRKMGHVTATGSTRDEVESRALRAASAIRL